MKTILTLCISLIILSATATAEKQEIKIVAVIKINTYAHGLESALTTQMFREEAKKIGNISVMSGDDMRTALESKGITPTATADEQYLKKAGNALQCDYLITGKISTERDEYFIKVVLFDVTLGLEKNISEVYYEKNPEKIQQYIYTSLNDVMKEKTSAEFLNNNLENNFKDANKEKFYSRKGQQGPRIGYTFLTGNTAKLYKAPEATGGYGMNPALFQFGYQLETRYMANGRFEGLVEWIPTITGMDQGKIFPSLTILNGIRDTKLGLEIAAGPVIFFKKVAMGYYDATGWHLEREWYLNSANLNSTPPNFITRADSRGLSKITSGVVIGIGKTFRSGNLRIPVNGYIVPGKNGWRFGVSFGFNLDK